MKPVLGIILLLVVIWMRGAFFFPDAEKPAASLTPTQTPAVEAVTGELLAYTATREDAERIAVLYSIELTSWEGGLAVFHTARDPAEVIAEGAANGWPTLSLNRVDQPF